ncbi:hypothetical protein NPIL_467441 [Nephila pilipes]|uniref:Uncharacterized protein n=1 Tax=Nephila pilipes TaxID=299642 RepID=A0A8X6JHJ8_NEPPI|nr:hypothetical protein NPIL_467441 [Nephila pilipes]
MCRPHISVVWKAGHSLKFPRLPWTSPTAIALCTARYTAVLTRNHTQVTSYALRSGSQAIIDSAIEEANALHHYGRSTAL